MIAVSISIRGHKMYLRPWKDWSGASFSLSNGETLLSACSFDKMDPVAGNRVEVPFLQLEMVETGLRNRRWRMGEGFGDAAARRVKIGWKTEMRWRLGEGESLC